MLHEGARQQRISPVRPVMEGDIIAEQRVAGFAWTSADGAVRSTHLDDRLLFAGEEHLVVPPDRSVPQTYDQVGLAVPMPPEDLPSEQVLIAASIDPAIAVRAGAFLDLLAAPWQPIARPLLAAVHATGHRAWLSGGTARDIVSGVPLREINDLDLAGTVPTGRFSDILYQSLRAQGMSEFPTTVNPRSLVCAVQFIRSTDRLLEYRGLSRSGFRFPVVGSRLAEDARHRDFAFNAVLYDALDHEILDPSGRGVTDLLGESRCLWPLSRPRGLGEAGEVIIRAMKFAVRWRAQRIDIEPFCAWIEELPADLCQRLDADQWSALNKYYRKETTALVEHQLEFAARLPQPVRELLETLIGRGR